MNVTKQELIDSITNELGCAGTPISKVQVDAVLNRLSIVAARTLKAGGDLPLPGIGKLKATQRAARAGRNPATGEAIEIPAKTVVKLSVGKALEDTLNQL